MFEQNQSTPPTSLFAFFIENVPAKINCFNNFNYLIVMWLSIIYSWILQLLVKNFLSAALQQPSDIFSSNQGENRNFHYIDSRDANTANNIKSLLMTNNELISADSFAQRPNNDFIENGILVKLDENGEIFVKPLVKNVQEKRGLQKSLIYRVMNGPISNNNDNNGNNNNKNGGVRDSRGDNFMRFGRSNRFSKITDARDFMRFGRNLDRSQNTFNADWNVLNKPKSYPGLSYLDIKTLDYEQNVSDNQ